MIPPHRGCVNGEENLEIWTPTFFELFQRVGEPRGPRKKRKGRSRFGIIGDACMCVREGSAHSPRAHVRYFDGSLTVRLAMRACAASYNAALAASSKGMPCDT